ncbi:MAG TPA: hypothetical protein VK982_06800 [Bacteroidales bacterium]|nr:hypothetical protein [Bacteroidales bacterium]
MYEQILSNLMAHLRERKDEVYDRYISTKSAYSDGKLDGIEEIINYITGEEMCSLNKESINRYEV